MAEYIAENRPEFPLKEMISSNEKISNEFFPSLLFNYLIKKDYEVNLIPVNNFIHYGEFNIHNDSRISLI